MLSVITLRIFKRTIIFWLQMFVLFFFLFPLHRFNLSMSMFNTWLTFIIGYLNYFLFHHFNVFLWVIKSKCSYTPSFSNTKPYLFAYVKLTITCYSNKLSAFQFVITLQHIYLYSFKLSYICRTKTLLLTFTFILGVQSAMNGTYLRMKIIQYFSLQY